MEAINYDIRNMKNDIDILLKRTRNYEDSLKLVNSLEEKLEKRLTDIGTQGVQRRFQNRIDELEKDLAKFIELSMTKHTEIKNETTKRCINIANRLENDILQILNEQNLVLEILHTVHGKTILPLELIEKSKGIIDSFIGSDDEENIFYYQYDNKVYDFTNIVKYNYNSKCIQNFTQWLTINNHLSKITDIMNKMETGRVIIEIVIKDWQDSIQELISYIRTLPSKHDETKIMTQIENIDISKQEEIISQDSANLMSNTNILSFIKNTNDEITTLTSDNLLEKCVEYTKIYKPDIPCIVQVLQHMLSSKQYVLSKDMFDKKLNLQEINKDFKLQAYQDMLTEDDLKNLLFV